MIRTSLALLALASLAACATRPEGPAETVTTPTEAAPTIRLQSASFSDLPGWANADLAPALLAFKRQCQTLRNRAPDSALGADARYGGRVGDWLPACAAADNAQAGQERAFFEANFLVSSIASENGQARLTGYYEPIIQASRTPTGVMTEPLLSRPNDMVTVDLRAFAEAYDSETLRGAPRSLTGKMDGARVRPYPSRTEIGSAPVSRAIGYAHPADVYNLQVQGSGRLQFADGQQARAAFAAQNGYRWRSALGAARESGALTDGTWRGFRAYLDQQDANGARAALNADPSYVFFAEEPITDPLAGPRGAAGVPLTPLGSMAVDPAFHPYGALIFVDTTYAGAAFQRLVVAQDTGGAIRRGPLRGDIFFGSGPEAGAQAEQMNAQAPRFWTLIPRGAPIAVLDDVSTTAG
ncbi:MAG: MltA domain-containing protein [Hyphomonadaceae bacterium]